MIDRERFDSLVHEALSHLYDFPYLETSPLSAALGVPGRQEGGSALHRILIESIERLKPSRDVDGDSVAWKVYRVLHLRFVRSLSAGAVARELGLSTRQAQRIQIVAVASVATLLRESRGSTSASATLPDKSVSDVIDDIDPVLEDELTAILAGDPGDVEPFLATLRGAVETVRPIVDARGARLELAADDDLDARIAPRQLVRPAIVQLLLAALDGAGSGQVVVVARMVGSEVELSISLEAVGQPVRRDDWRDVFERRLRVARTLLGGVNGLVEARFEPQPRIDVRLPLQLAMMVLVVEDNAQVAQLLERYLSGSAYRMLRAENGLTGLEVARSAQPSAITLDLLMPHQDGWELLQALKVHPDTRHIPVIVCSVLRERELALALGATDFLPKPVTQHAFLAALNRHSSRLARSALTPQYSARTDAI
jgi:CheY-like chemotaxis protein